MPITDHPQADEFIEFIQELADTASAFLEKRHQGSRFETKQDASPVTEFDRGVETALRNKVAERFPEHGIIGEEYPPVRDDAEFVWIMDPIDGTKAFVSGIPVFTTLIALCRNGYPVVGVINASVTGDRWLGVEGQPTTLNGREVRTSGRTSLDGATLTWSQPDTILDEHAVGYVDLTDRVAWTVFGAASFGMGRVAAGAIDVGVLSGGIGAYDVCALVPVIQGAGGKITDVDSTPISIRPPRGCVVAATPELHDEVLATLTPPV